MIVTNISRSAGDSNPTFTYPAMCYLLHHTPHVATPGNDKNTGVAMSYRCKTEMNHNLKYYKLNKCNPHGRVS